MRARRLRRARAGERRLGARQGERRRRGGPEGSLFRRRARADATRRRFIGLGHAFAGHRERGLGVRQGVPPRRRAVRRASAPRPNDGSATGALQQPGPGERRLGVRQAGGARRASAVHGHARDNQGARGRGRVHRREHHHAGLGDARRRGERRDPKDRSARLRRRFVRFRVGGFGARRRARVRRLERGGARCDGVDVRGRRCAAV